MTKERRGIPALPTLRTLEERTSWMSGNNRMDRSAMVAVKAARLARAVHPADRQSAKTLSGRECYAVVTVTGDWVERGWRGERPRSLLGDYRPQAWAMRPDGQRMGTRWSHDGRKGSRPLRALGQQRPGPDHGLPPNPNRGACAQKRPVGGDWSQRVSVEWWVQTSKRAGDRVGRGDRRIERDVMIRRAFFVCPGLYGCADAGTGPRRAAAAAEARAIARLPLEERTRRGLHALNPTYNRKRQLDVCDPAVRRRVEALYLPLAWEREWEDAAAAGAWLEAVGPVAASHPAAASVARLVERYGPLLRPRLMCRQCLGVRYGALMKSTLHPGRRSWFWVKPEPSEGWQGVLEAVEGRAK